MGLPRSEDMTDDIWPDGTYPARIEKAEETRSKQGNDMLKLTVSVLSPDGQSQTVYDYITYKRKPDVQRLEGLTSAIGKREQHDKGALEPRHLEKREVSVMLGYETSRNPQYPDRNKILAYTPANRSATVAAGAVDEDDDVPF
jgi:hypothetical protein